MTNIKDYYEEKNWYDKFFVKNVLKKKYEERAIIDNLYALYKLYPDYYEVTSQYEELKTAKIVRTIQIARESLKSIVTASAAMALTSLIGMEISPECLLSTAGITVGGAVAFYNSNKDDIVMINLSKKQQAELYENLVCKCDDFFSLITSYLEKIQDYVLLYDETEDSIEWNNYLKNMFESNNDYIESRKEEGLFDIRFNINTAGDVHDRIFDRDELNNDLLEKKQLYRNKNVNSKLKTKKKY